MRFGHDDILQGDQRQTKFSSIFMRDCFGHSNQSNIENDILNLQLPFLIAISFALFVDLYQHENIIIIYKRIPFTLPPVVLHELSLCEYICT